MSINDQSALARNGVRHAGCPENLYLANKIIEAVRGVYDSRAAINRAVKEKKDFAPFAKSLAIYRAAEREAVRLLDEHRKQHGC